jgi:hypothetical protein
MTESILWNDMRKFLPQSLDMTRHEDKYRSGIPDVSYGVNGVNGWIELKFEPRWPRDGILRYRKFKETQRVWLRARGESGGHCYILTIVGSGKQREYLLHSWRDEQLLGVVSRDELVEFSQLCWNYSQWGDTREKLLKILTS